MRNFTDPNRRLAQVGADDYRLRGSETAVIISAFFLMGVVGPLPSSFFFCGAVGGKEGGEEGGKNGGKGGMEYCNMLLDTQHKPLWHVN